MPAVSNEPKTDPVARNPTLSLYAILEGFDEGSRAGRTISLLIFVLIFLNVIASILESLGPLHERLERPFYLFEVFSVGIFTIEYLARLWVCVRHPRYRHPVLGRVKHALTPLALVDLAAILPLYLPWFIPFDIRFLRVLRLIRVFSHRVALFLHARAHGHVK